MTHQARHALCFDGHMQAHTHTQHISSPAWERGALQPQHVVTHPRRQLFELLLRLRLIGRGLRPFAMGAPKGSWGSKQRKP